MPPITLPAATVSPGEPGDLNLDAVTGTQTTAGEEQTSTLDLSRAAVIGGSLA